MMRPPDRRQTVERDMRTGIVSDRIRRDDGVEHDRDTGLTCGSTRRSHHSIDPSDPLSARAEWHWTTTVERGAWKTRTETYSSMTCTETHFQVSGRIEAYENEMLAFDTSFSENIARDMV